MNQIIKSGSTYSAHEFDSVSPKLELGVYTLMFNMEKGFYLKKNGDYFPLPDKIYNSNEPLIKRWLKAWENTPKNMGIFLTGEKGTGKTITAQMLANMSGMPVIILTTPYNSEGFKQYMANPLFKNCIVFIDEFEKVYSQEQGHPEGIEPLLSLLDGMYDTRLLFVLTTNSDRLSPFLMNRPGRIKYRTDFGFLTPDTAEEIIQDKLINMENESSLYDLLNDYGNVTMDILTKVIDDMNLFNENAITCAKYMNLQASAKDYDVYFKLNDSETLIECFSMYGRTFNADSYFDENIGFSSDSVIKIANEIARLNPDYDFKEILDQTTNHVYYEGRMNKFERNKDGSIIIKDVRYCTLPALQKKTSESNKEELPISASVAERKLDVIAKQLNLSSPVLVKGELILRPMKKFFARTRIIDSSLAF